MDSHSPNLNHTGNLVRSTEHAAAFDLQAAVSLMLAPGQRCLVPTGVHVDMPPYMAAFVLPRSGLAFKKGITITNAPGLIDPDYAGDIGVILQNDGDELFVVEKGDRIAQLMFVPFFTPTLTQVETLHKVTERGTGGFGSTGVQSPSNPT